MKGGCSVAEEGRERGRERGGVWVSLLLFGREKEERFPVVAVAAAAAAGVGGGRTDGRTD